MIMRYKTDMMGLIPPGKEIYCHVLSQDGEKYLVYHTDKIYWVDNGKVRMDKGCGCIEICKLNNNILEGCGEFINLIDTQQPFKKFLKSIKPIRLDKDGNPI